MKNLLTLALLTLGLASCTQDEPIARNTKLNFSGWEWTVKASESRVGPGYGYFSNRAKDVFVDANGYLHLRIAKNFQKWYSTEVISTDTFSYGTYTFTIQGDMSNLDPNIVFGLFTWSDYGFKEAANSEVDIEFAKFGNPDAINQLQYTVQPLNNGAYPERYNRPTYAISYGSSSTHSFTWTPTSIVWKSYEGEDLTKAPVTSWSFGLANRARRKYQMIGTTLDSSNAIVIPKVTRETRVHLNFWSLGPEANLPDGPKDGQEKEVVVKKFEYKKLN